ncbi:MAG TPA: hypothetical protein VN922_02740, partial [Bacteroidia bacterium]|nr:hypothetical protein [Bacteroidia bacterium]
MRKTLLILSILAQAQLFGQAVPNGGFESWTSTPYNEVSGWYSSNPQSLSMMGIANVTKVTGFSGSAVHLQTYISGQDSNFAYVSNSPGDPTQGQGGVPYSQKPTGITGYYRYNLPVHDSALLLVIFKKSGSIINTYIFKIHGTGSLTTFTSFNYTFTPALTITPDSIIVAAASSNAIQNIGVQNGSWLEIDQLAFAGATQAIPGGNFDTWNSFAFDSPNGWQVETNGKGTSGVSKTTSSYSGTYALSLVSQS